MQFLEILQCQANLKQFWRLLASSEPGEMADVACHQGGGSPWPDFGSHSCIEPQQLPWDKPGHEPALLSVLQNVSFILHPGKVTALVGPSGSGKSSCVNILENFYPLQDGQVLLDGHPINMYDHKYLHSVVRAPDTCIRAVACRDQRGWMVALCGALDLIWQLLKCPESWRWSRK